MYLAHAAPLFLAPLPVVVAVLAVAVSSIFMDSDMLGPE
jgi:hypothetical protein